MSEAERMEWNRGEVMECINETARIQEFAIQWNESQRKPVLHPVLIPMPDEMCASNMPGITEVPVCSI